MTLEEIDKALEEAIEQSSSVLFSCEACKVDYLKHLIIEHNKHYDDMVEFVDAHLNTYSACAYKVCTLIFVSALEFNKEIAIRYLENEFVGIHTICHNGKALSKFRDMIRDIQLPYGAGMEIE